MADPLAYEGRNAMRQGFPKLEKPGNMLYQAKKAGVECRIFSYESKNDTNERGNK